MPDFGVRWPYEDKRTSETGQAVTGEIEAPGAAPWLEPSRVVREGLQLLDVYYGKPAGKRFVGIGRVDSGITDLGSNKKHLTGFHNLSVAQKPFLPTAPRTRVVSHR